MKVSVRQGEMFQSSSLLMFKSNIQMIVMLVRDAVGLLHVNKVLEQIQNAKQRQNTPACEKMIEAREVMDEIQVYLIHI